MCDYSLHLFTNRLANQGEALVIHRFSGGSIGLASPQEVSPAVLSCPPRRSWSWITLRSWFEAGPRAEPQPCAVCIPSGATLVLRDIPVSLRRELGVGEIELVTLIQTTAKANTYRDAVRFSNQRQILLQGLRPGQRVTVVNLELDSSTNERDIGTTHGTAHGTAHGTRAKLRRPSAENADPRCMPAGRSAPGTELRS